MNRQELIDELSERTGVTKAAAGKTIKALFDPEDGIISEELQDGGTVALTGFGKFSTAVRSAREMRNPQTGDMIDVPEKTVAKFKVGATLASTVNGD